MAGSALLGLLLASLLLAAHCSPQIEEIFFESIYDTAATDQRKECANVADNWWRTASFYQIYPRSFQDSNGDGIGDLNGITARLSYLAETGITAAWMSPIFRSPMADFGYDISNYFDIQPEYGTLADFDRLIARARQLGVRIILDFVPNHTSDEHDWFRLSTQRDEHFADYYIWHPGFVDAASGRRRPPNNWVSVFGKSAWQFNERRGEYYLHQFSVKQPDLNYRNPKVVEMMKSVLRYWLKRGVAGFRVDAVPFLFEVPADAAGNYPDEPLSGVTQDPNDWNYLRHVYTTDRNETVDMVYEWRQTLDEFRRDNGGEERVMLTECYSTIEMVMRYYGNATHNGSHVPFNFAFIEGINNQSTAHDYVAIFDTWMQHMPKGRTPNWVFGNHDQHRVASRLGTNRIDAVNMIVLTLPGISVSYNGEEIGMTDVWISWHDTVDPAACNTNATVYERFSRDPERTPFQWDDSISAGFSSNSHTWLPVADNYRSINVKAEAAAGQSHLLCYRKLVALRQTATMLRGGWEVKAANDNVLVIVRNLAGENTYVTVVNIGGRQESVNLKTFTNMPDKLRYSIVSSSSKHVEGTTVDAQSVALEPYESFVLKADGPAISTSKLNAYYYYLHSEK